MSRNLASIVPPQGAISITPNDGANLTVPVKAMNVAVAGTVRVTTVGADTVDIYVAAGIAFPLEVLKVWSTGTTATGIVGLF